MEKKELVWVQFASAALQNPVNIQIAAKANVDVYTYVSSIADRMWACFQERFSDEAWLLNGQKHCSTCGEELKNFTIVNGSKVCEPKCEAKASNATAEAEPSYELDGPQLAFQDSYDSARERVFRAPIENK